MTFDLPLLREGGMEMTSVLDIAIKRMVTELNEREEKHEKLI